MALVIKFTLLVCLVFGLNNVDCSSRHRRELSNESMVVQLLESIAASLEKLTKGVKVIARDCSVVASQGPYMSGPYHITPWDQRGSFRVRCDMDTEGGGWTVVQRRFDGTVDFYRGWEDYKTGFGDIDGEFWLGLSKLNRLTSSSSGQNWHLRIELEDFENNTAYAQYDNFAIGDESTGFQLDLGSYSGTAGDGLTYHAGLPFTTKDRDNDSHGNNCGVLMKGGWWYGGCHRSNLNGLYIGSAQESTAAMVWFKFTGNRHVALKRSEMKIRPSR